MSTKLSTEVIHGMARELAGLELDPDRLKLLTPRLEGLLGEINRLDELDLNEVEPAPIIEMKGE
ncbi:MAG: hypothetical protein HYS70_01680 [Nitrospinae bacterium]|nr:hypothetical protein [Nitrospinota bacterium]